MRIQATALLSMDQKKVLEDQAEDHEAAQTTVLVAAHLAFTSLPRLEQVVWIKMAEKEKGSTCG